MQSQTPRFPSHLLCLLLLAALVAALASPAVVAEPGSSFVEPGVPATTVPSTTAEFTPPVIAATGSAVDVDQVTPLAPRFPGPDGQPLPFRSDDEVLSFLHTAEIVGSKQLSTGINRPMKLTLEKDGVRAHAVFRTVNRLLTPNRGDRPDPRAARDSYLFEVAAYKLSRRLGIDRVPPVVLREVDGKRGSIQLWIENAKTEAAVLESPQKNIGVAQRQVQKEVMQVFDQLVYNFDRHHANSLYDSYGHLWFIDHTRTFKGLHSPENLNRIAVCDTTLYRNLKSLDRKELRDMLGSYLDFMQIDSIVRRRDKIVNHLDQLVAERGETAVLYNVAKLQQAPEKAPKIELQIVTTPAPPSLKPSI